jgi:DNA-binding MarR family transcriptional regulator
MGPPKPRATSRRPADAVAEDASAVVRCLRRLFKGLHEHSKAMQRKVGLSAPQAWALTILAEEPGLSLGDLAERMHAHPSTVSGIVDRLVGGRSVDRRSDPEDRRGIRLSLTPSGRRLLRRSPPPVQAGLQRALRGMAPRRLRLLRRALEEIVRTSELEEVEAAFVHRPPHLSSPT